MSKQVSKRKRTSQPKKLGPIAHSSVLVGTATPRITRRPSN